jgi:hypothetical protein
LRQESGWGHDCLHKKSMNLTSNQRPNSFITLCTVGWMVSNLYLASPFQGQGIQDWKWFYICFVCQN